MNKRYPLDARNFTWSRSGNTYKFFVDDKEVDFVSWNKTLNERLSMDQFEAHPNIIVRHEMKSRIRRIVRLLDAKEDEVIVDIGAEKGQIASQVTAYRMMVCLDIDYDMLREARTILNNPRMHFVVADAQHLPLKNKRFDKAMSNHLLEHLPDPSQGVAELFRVVRDTGKVVINVPNEQWVLFCKKILDRTVRIMRWGYPGRAPGHLHNFGTSLLVSLCKKVNGTVESLQLSPFFTQIIARVSPSKGESSGER